MTEAAALLRRPAEARGVHAETFVDDPGNVVFFEHVGIDKDLSQSLGASLLAPGDKAIGAKIRDRLAELLRQKIGVQPADIAGPRGKYVDVASHVRAIYLLLLPGMEDMVAGHTLGREQEDVVKQVIRELLRDPAFTGCVHTGLAERLRVVGLAELGPLFARVEAYWPEVRHMDYVTREGGRGGYDTPKFCEAVLRLARQDFAWDEVFLRIDDDVLPTEVGVRELKAAYARQMRSGGNLHFCYSWHYRAHGGGTPEALSEQFLNDSSIRVGFLVPACFTCKETADPKDGPFVRTDRLPDTLAALNLVAVRFFLDLFRLGKWGSNLKDPISGAGLCFRPESLVELPPFCNASELVMWIDDFVKAEIMSGYYAPVKDANGNEVRRFSEAAMLPATSTTVVAGGGEAGFVQDRNRENRQKTGDRYRVPVKEGVAWHVNTYLDRLLEGCILAFCANPSRYLGAQNTPAPSLVDVLRQHEYTTASAVWERKARPWLRQAALTHARNILTDWNHYFCEHPLADRPVLAVDASGQPFAPPTGFRPAPPDTWFNAWVLRHLRRMELPGPAFDLVDKVLAVLDRYLKLKFDYWPQVVRVIDTVRAPMLGWRAPGQAPELVVDDLWAWMFHGLTAGSRPAATRPTAKDSEAAYALIREVGADGEACAPERWLLQWNTGWRVMNLISGHREPFHAADTAIPTAPQPADRKESFAACVVREVYEELFRLPHYTRAADGAAAARRTLGTWRDLPEAITAGTITLPAGGPADPMIAKVELLDSPAPYTAFSEAGKRWSWYTVRIFDVELTPAGWSDLWAELLTDPVLNPGLTACLAKDVAEFVDADDIRRGCTPLGRPISPTVRQVWEWVHRAP